ncbi:uncharacterized protein PG998_007006 [Apiospora kogelbergensis]|uniref:Uncharacterized protein n=1 Tax=Apiospora kogelbergensis TaxID=1337665 RepID=A0AAW0QEI3_9PEZI
MTSQITNNNEKAPVVVNTTDLVPSSRVSETTTLGANNEKDVVETSMDLGRNSSVSTPSTAHHLNPFDADIEAARSSDNLNLNRKSISAQPSHNQDCSVWPGQDHWKRKAKAAKRENRMCNCLAHLSRRNRIIVKLLIALLIIGIAVGVGVGISKPLGADIWKPQGS